MMDNELIVLDSCISQKNIMNFMVDNVNCEEHPGPLIQSAKAVSTMETTFADWMSPLI